MKPTVLTIIISLFFFSCTEKKTIKHPNVFRYNESKGIATLDPAFAKSQVLIWPVNQIFNGLVQMDNQLSIKPCIAKSWEIDEARKRYIFYLRNDVRFH
ncbi:MAG TPA: hypothetical protein VK982_01105, partial [Bacteroidales bacterium]|nr:hypothetical protein [Bacteroidales bacterium]